MKYCFASQPFERGQTDTGSPIQMQMNNEAAWKNTRKAKETQEITSITTKQPTGFLALRDFDFSSVICGSVWGKPDAKRRIAANRIIIHGSEKQERPALAPFVWRERS